MAGITRWIDYLVPLALIACVLVIFIPLPPVLMDTLLATNICVALIVVLTAINVKTPLEFSIFPTLLLATTLVRLVLNIATTRLILSDGGTEQVDAAGGIIKGFGEFVSGNNLVIGLVIFAIILIIQFVVITKGATRISEVAARFALDGMPGKQMSIDADLSAGIIDQAEAQRRREEIVEQSDFFSSMDGASKFVRGDAIAGLVITAINIVGGLAIGLWEGMSIENAAGVYTKLTIGDGLVSQIPAFLIALAAGILVTRSSRPTNLPTQFLKQLFANSETLLIAGSFIALLVFAKMPAGPTLSIGGGCVLLSFLLRRNESNESATESQVETCPTEEKEKSETIKVEHVLAVDPIEIELGMSLLPMLDQSKPGNLLDKIDEIRRSVAADLGIVLPNIRFKDDMSLDRNEYRIKLLSNSIASGKLRANKLIALDTGNTKGELDGIPAEGSAGQPNGTWINPGLRLKAEQLGYVVLAPTKVLAHHVRRIASRHANELMNRTTVRQMVNELRKKNPVLVDELIPDSVSMSELLAVLKRLLSEAVSVRQLGLIIESIAEFKQQTMNIEQIAESVRGRLSRTICERFRDKLGNLPVMMLDENLESQLIETIDSNGRRKESELENICCGLVKEIQLHQRTAQPVLLVPASIRRKLSDLVHHRIANLTVLSYREIPGECQTETVAIIGEAA